MPEPALPATPPNDHLTRKFLRRALRGNDPVSALLEQICTDSVYVFRDDFDTEGLDRRWTTFGPPAEGSEEDRGGGYAFQNDPSRPGGWIHGQPGVSPLLLVGTYRVWRASRRAAMQARLRFTSLGSTKFEIGFADVDVEDAPGVPGVVNAKSIPSANPSRNDFAVAIRDTEHNTSLDLVANGSPASTSEGGTASIALTALSGPEPIQAAQEFTVMIATNEMRESRFWVNGIPGGANSSGPYRDAPLCLWFYFQPRAGGGPLVGIDYVQAWQERTEL